jgi:hypothetical protein
MFSIARDALHMFAFLPLNALGPIPQTDNVQASSRSLAAGNTKRNNEEHLLKARTH